MAVTVLSEPTLHEQLKSLFNAAVTICQDARASPEARSYVQYALDIPGGLAEVPRARGQGDDCRRSLRNGNESHGRPITAIPAGEWLKCCLAYRITRPGSDWKRIMAAVTEDPGRSTVLRQSSLSGRAAPQVRPRWSVHRRSCVQLGADHIQGRFRGRRRPFCGPIRAADAARSGEPEADVKSMTFHWPRCRQAGMSPLECKSPTGVQKPDKPPFQLDVA